MTFDGTDDHHGDTKKCPKKGDDKGKSGNKELSKEEECKEEEAEGEVYNPKDDRDIDKKRMYRERREQFEEAMKCDAPTTSYSRASTVKKMRHDYFHK